MLFRSELHQEMPGIGLATVYRTLKSMVEDGLLDTFITDDGQTLYRRCSSGHHHHIVCSRCGAVNDFASCDIQGLLNEIAERTGYAIDAHRLEVYGRCAACRGSLD